MKKIFNNKRVKIVTRLCAIIFFIFTIIFTSLCLDQHGVNAAATSQGSRETAHQKLYAEALTKCVNKALESSLPADQVAKVKNGEKSPFSSGYVQSLLIEQHFKNQLTEWDDGILDCNHNKGELASNSTLSSYNMGFSQKELFCNGQKAGIFVSNDANVAGCSDIYEGNSSTSLKKVGTDPDSSAFGGRVGYVQHLVTTKTFGGNPPGGNLSFTELESYYIYYDTFFTACADKSSKRNDSNLHYQIKAWDSTKKDFVTYGYTQKSNKIEPTQYFYVTDTQYMSCDELAGKLNSGSAFNAYSTMKKAAAANPGDPSVEDPDDPESTTSPTDPPGSTTSDPTCLTEAGSLGWIACTTADSMGSFAKGAYESMVEKYLRIEPEFLSNSKGSTKPDTTQDAWSIFRDIANVGFIILLLVIIFSQLTGVGIDNYGIKKTLPKLVITALLVNMSYLICQAAVDVSNIVGNSAKGLLEGIAGTIAEAGGHSYDWGVLIGTILAAVGVGGVAGAITVIGMGIWALLLPLLLGLLSAVIGIIFAFFLLGARKALVIVLVVVSPVALLFYALPNTKKIFDKWFKIFKAMILVYPICGFLMGGGALASSIIMNSLGGDGDFYTSLAGMAIRIIPIFFVPSMMKGAFAVLGGVGAKLSGLGKNLSNRATSGINRGVKDSNAWKDYQERHSVDMANMRTNMLKKRGEKRLASGKSSTRFGRSIDSATGLTATETLRQARAQNVADKYSNAKEDAYMSNYEKQFGGNSFDGPNDADDYESGIGEQFQTMFEEDNENGEALAAFTRYMFKRDSKEASKVISNVLAKNGASGKKNSMDTLRKVINKDSNIAGYMKAKETDTFQMMSAGRNAGNLTDYTGNLSNNNHSDWASMSTGALRRAIKKGSLSVGTAKELLNSESSNIRDTIQGDPEKRSMLGAYVANNGITSADGKSIFDKKGRGLSDHGKAMSEKYFNPPEEPTGTGDETELNLDHKGDETFQDGAGI